MLHMTVDLMDPKRHPALPAAERMRPQLGSEPAIAVFTEVELAMWCDCDPRLSFIRLRRLISMGLVFARPRRHAHIAWQVFQQAKSALQNARARSRFELNFGSPLTEAEQIV